MSEAIGTVSADGVTLAERGFRPGDRIQVGDGQRPRFGMVVVGDDGDLQVKLDPLMNRKARRTAAAKKRKC